MARTKQYVHIAKSCPKVRKTKSGFLGHWPGHIHTSTSTLNVWICIFGPFVCLHQQNYIRKYVFAICVILLLKSYSIFKCMSCRNWELIDTALNYLWYTFHWHVFDAWSPIYSCYIVYNLKHTLHIFASRIIDQRIHLCCVFCIDVANTPARSIFKTVLCTCHRFWGGRTPIDGIDVKWVFGCTLWMPTAAR